jgi:hypothetical protein
MREVGQCKEQLPKDRKRGSKKSPRSLSVMNALAAGYRRSPWLIIYLPLPVPLPEGEVAFLQASSLQSMRSPDPKRERFFGVVRSATPLARSSLLPPGDERMDARGRAMQGAIAEGQEEGIEIIAVVATGNECHGWIPPKPWRIILPPSPCPSPGGRGDVRSGLVSINKLARSEEERFFGIVRSATPLARSSLLPPGDERMDARGRAMQGAIAEGQEEGIETIAIALWLAVNAVSKPLSRRKKGLAIEFKTQAKRGGRWCAWQCLVTPTADCGAT